MVTQFLASSGEQLHSRAAAERRQRITTLSRSREKIHTRLTGNSKFPFESFVVWLQVVIGQRPIDDVIAGEVGAGALGIAAGNFIRKKLEITGHVTGHLTGPMQECAAEHVQ